MHANQLIVDMSSMIARYKCESHFSPYKGSRFLEGEGEEIAARFAGAAYPTN